MIKKLRREKGITQSELAKILNLSKSHISRMESRKIRKSEGYRASYSTIKLLAKNLDGCPLKIFAFFANVDCKYIKLTAELNKYSQCEYKSCINDEILNILQLNIVKSLKHLRLENAKLKKQLRQQRRTKSNTFYTYRKRNEIQN
jgi:transcriptional regulator with XRE-family HTH domain